ncbi:MAG: leucine-rich repeat protein [Bacteroidaceae bacterium]|nr:leucine-rich repeat protein [Bacteroidaceae bacterium]
MNKLTKMMATLAVLLCCANQLYAATQTFDAWSSPSTNHSSSSSNTYTFTTVGNTILSFDWSVSCEEYFDIMVINLDGINILTKSGKNNGTFSQELSEGEHTLTVTYTKDEAGSDGDDGCKISNVKVAPNMTISSGYSILDDWESTNKSNGSTSSNKYIFSNTVNALISFDWMVSSESGGDKLIILLDGVTILTDSGEKNGTHAASLAPGEHTLEVKYTKDSSDKEGQDCAKISNVNVKAVESSEMLCFPSWKSTNKSNSSTSSKLYTFYTNGNAILSYDWLVSSESADKLTVTLDSKIVLTKSGEYNGSISHTLSSGAHRLLVKYTKDSSDDEGGDFGEISNIVVENVIASGACGENLSWRLYHTGLLKISGTGEMANYSTSSSQKAPWDSYKASIVSVKIEDGVTTVGSYAFYEHTALTNIEFPKGIVSIGASAFARCTAFSSFTIPDGITTISSEMLMHCSNLTTVVVPESITTIGEYAFYGSGLTTITIPSSVTSIKSRAFMECAKMESITIPKSVTTIGDVVFSGCSGELNVYCNIPYDSYGIFRNANFSKVVIGDEVTKIGGNAFIYCDNLKFISIPKSVTSIGSYAFKECTNLEEITIPEGVKTIENSTFYKCSSLKTITIPNGVTSIGNNAFYSCESLESVKIPEGVTSIGSYAFEGCKSLESVKIPEGVTVIGSSAFGVCVTLKSVSIPNSVTSIGSYAFFSCESLESVKIPEGVTEIGGSAFSGCHALESVIIPNSVTSIGNGVFEYCNKLSSIVVSEENEYYDSRNNCNAIIETKSNTLIASCLGTIIPNTVTTIGEEAFSGSELKEINIPNSVTTIGDRAFANSSITEINIPSSVTTIGKEAFYFCYYSKKIVIPESVESIGDNAFKYCSNLDVYFHKNIDLSNLSLDSKAKMHLIINDESNKDLDTSISNKYTDITYNRNLTPGKYETIILPFVPNAESLENFAFYELTSVDGDVLNFSEVSDPQANTPYLYTLRPGKYSTEITGGETTISSEINTPRVAAWKTIGSYASQIVDCSVGDGYYYDINTQNNKLQNNVTNLILKPYHAYFKSAIASAATLNIHINGKAINETYTITYIVDNEVYHVESLEPNNQIPAIESPQKEGYTFNGWETLPSNMPNENITVYAKFTPNKYTITFKANGEIVSSESLAYGTTIVAPEAPEKEYYAFVEWTNLLETVPAYDVEFVAVYKQIGIHLIDAGTSFSQDEAISFDRIRYTRTFNNTNWQALYVPFEIPVTEEFLADFEVADLNDVRQYDRNDDGVKDETVIEAFKVKSGVLEANYPYLIRAREAGEKTITVTDATLYATEENSIDCSSVRDKFTFTGTYSQLSSEELPQGEGYYALSGGVWQPVAEGASLGAFRFYLKVDSRNNLNAAQGNAIRMRIIGEDGEEDDATGIDTPEFKDQNSELIFDLLGRRVDNPTKGVYIINGVKRVF